MKTLQEHLTSEAMNTRLTYNIQNDIYTSLSNLAFEYSMKHKEFEKEGVEKALEWFMNKFWE